MDDIKTLRTDEKPVVEDVVATGVDVLPDTTPEAEVAAKDKPSTAFYRPVVRSNRTGTFTRPNQYTDQPTPFMVTRNGLFPPTLFGSSEPTLHTPGLVRHVGSKGYNIPVDDLRLDGESLKSPVTRL